MLTAAEVIRLLGLEPLSLEGGWYRETHRPPGPGERALSSCIYYLVTQESFSSLHRLPGDEVWHFCGGDAVDMLLLHGAGHGEVRVLGADLEAGQRPQVVVPTHVWQGAAPVAGGHHGWALLGTTMTPGFEPSNFEAGDRALLCAGFPAFRARIEALTRG